MQNAEKQTPNRHKKQPPVTFLLFKNYCFQIWYIYCLLGKACCAPKKIKKTIKKKVSSHVRVMVMIIMIITAVMLCFCDERPVGTPWMVWSTVVQIIWAKNKHQNIICVSKTICAAKIEVSGWSFLNYMPPQLTCRPGTDSWRWGGLPWEICAVVLGLLCRVLKGAGCQSVVSACQHTLVG